MIAILVFLESSFISHCIFLLGFLECCITFFIFIECDKVVLVNQDLTLNRSEAFIDDAEKLVQFLSLQLITLLLFFTSLGELEVSYFLKIRFSC